MSIDDLPPLREVIRMHGLAARKSLGQNFILDLNLTARIARAAGPLEGYTVIEVGPGPGGLTRALLAGGADRVVAIERDERCLAALAEISSHHPGRLEVISADAVRFDYSQHVSGPTRIVANLPYSVATVLLIDWISRGTWPPWYDSMTLMFQREVAERIVAKPASKAFGRLAVMAGWRTQAQIVLNLPPQAFTPAPKVASALVHLVPRAQPIPHCDVAALERVTASAFGQRRKMLRASLRGLFADPVSVLETIGIDPSARAETLEIADFCNLANALTNVLGK